MKDAIGYLRVSTQEQGRSGLGVQTLAISSAAPGRSDAERGDGVVVHILRPIRITMTEFAPAPPRAAVDFASHTSVECGLSSATT
jgi:hypothetical protein